MTLLQTPSETPATALPLVPARPVRIRFHETPSTSMPSPGRPGSKPTPAGKRLWTLSASEAALDVALDRLIDRAARELRDRG